jgi:hypothetical protein
VLINQRSGRIFHMPIYGSQKWAGYEVQVQPDHIIRAAIWFFFRHDIASYLYGKDITMALLVWKKNKDVGKEIKYEWELFNSTDERNVIKRGEGSFKTSHRYTFVRSAIVIHDVSLCQQYKLKFRFGTNVEVFGDYFSAAEYTLEDRDKYYQDHILPIVITMILGAIFFIAGALWRSLMR